MISFRQADLSTNLRFRDVEVAITALVGEASSITGITPFFVKFYRPESGNPAVEEKTDARLRGILEAKSYVKDGDAFILRDLPSKNAAESAFMDVLKYLRHHNSIISAEIDTPVKYLPGTKVKQFVIRMKTRG